MSRLEFLTEAAARAVAERITRDMEREGKLEPYTYTWAEPYQEASEAERALQIPQYAPVRDNRGRWFDVRRWPSIPGRNWYVNVEGRCAGYLNPDERAKVPELFDE